LSYRLTHLCILYCYYYYYYYYYVPFPCISLPFLGAFAKYREKRLFHHVRVSVTTSSLNNLVTNEWIFVKFYIGNLY